MTETTSTPEKPKSSITKKLFYVIAIILGLLGIDHFTYHYVSGGTDVEVTVTDSTIISTASVVATPTVAVIDTARKDTTKK